MFDTKCSSVNCSKNANYSANIGLFMAIIYSGIKYKMQNLNVVPSLNVVSNLNVVSGCSPLTGKRVTCEAELL